MAEIIGIEVEEHHDRYTTAIYQIPADKWEAFKAMPPAQAAKLIAEQYVPAMTEYHETTEPSYVVKERVIPGPTAV